MMIMFTSQIEAVFGPVSGTNPLFILAVYSPGIAAVLLVWWHYGTKGLARFFRRLTLSPGQRADHSEQGKDAAQCCQ
jgi:hypothetical protein